MLFHFDRGIRGNVTNLDDAIKMSRVDINTVHGEVVLSTGNATTTRVNQNENLGFKNLESRVVALWELSDIKYCLLESQFSFEVSAF